MIAGIDSCPGGWVAVIEEAPQHLSAGIFLGLDHLLRHFPELEVAAIDIPIGLSSLKPRACDLLVRRQLKPRGSVVFPAPLRPLLIAPTYERARAMSTSLSGKSVSAQAYAIFKKVQQIDDELQASERLRQIAFEVHPERSFAEMNGGQVLPLPKRSLEGANLRLSLVDGLVQEGAFSLLRSRLKRSLVHDDDLLDALAALWTARRIHAQEHATVPEIPEIDQMGLPMRICY